MTLKKKMIFKFFVGVYVHVHVHVRMTTLTALNIEYKNIKYNHL